LTDALPISPPLDVVEVDRHRLADKPEPVPGDVQRAEPGLDLGRARPRWRGVVAGGVVPDRRPRAVVAGAVEGLDLDADVGARLDPAPGVGGGGDPAGRGGLVVEALLVRERIAGREPADLG